MKKTVGFSAGEKTADLELCVFCKHMTDISRPGECEHFQEKYEEYSCSEFISVDDVANRLFETLEARSVD